MYNGILSVLTLNNVAHCSLLVLIVLATTEAVVLPEALSLVSH